MVDLAAIGGGDGVAGMTHGDAENPCAIAGAHEFLVRRAVAFAPPQHELRVRGQAADDLAVGFLDIRHALNRPLVPGKGDDVSLAEIDADIAEAKSVGVTGTPAFFVNGRFLSGAKPFSEFATVINAELQKQNIPIPPAAQQAAAAPAGTAGK